MYTYTYMYVYLCLVYKDVLPISHSGVYYTVMCMGFIVSDRDMCPVQLYSLHLYMFCQAHNYNAKVPYPCDLEIFLQVM